MYVLPTVFSFVLLAAPLAATAQQNAVVLELFTSQGCSSCPPADALFEELASLDDVIGLALHVDYWDFIWPDNFANHANTLRQKAYARLMRQRTLFTPQMIIQGQDMLIGSDAPTILERISAHRATPSTVTLSVSREGDMLHVSLAPVAAGVGPAEIQVARFMPSQTVLIAGGDNEGKEITYTNVVQNWADVGDWDGQSEVRNTYPLEGDGPVAVIVQSAPLGPILAAAKLP